MIYFTDKRISQKFIQLEKNLKEDWDTYFSLARSQPKTQDFVDELNNTADRIASEYKQFYLEELADKNSRTTDDIARYIYINLNTLKKFAKIKPISHYAPINATNEANAPGLLKKALYYLIPTISSVKETLEGVYNNRAETLKETPSSKTSCSAYANSLKPTPV